MASSKRNAYSKLSSAEQIKEAHDQRYFAGIDSEFAKEYDDIMSQNQLSKNAKNAAVTALYKRLANNIDKKVSNHEKEHGINSNALHSEMPTHMLRGGRRRKTHRRKSHRRKTHRRS